MFIVPLNQTYPYARKAYIAGLSASLLLCPIRNEHIIMRL